MFVRIDVAAGATKPTHYKNEAFSKIEQPNSWGDLHIIIGIFGFYNQFLPNII